MTVESAKNSILGKRSFFSLNKHVQGILMGNAFFSQWCKLAMISGFICGRNFAWFGKNEPKIFIPEGVIFLYGFGFLGSLYSQDRILQAMGNITLAFHLLCERCNPNSFWLPYIQTLPNEYNTPLYFEEDEVQYLQSTQAIHDVFSQYKNTARQYAYFYKVIQVRTCKRSSNICRVQKSKTVAISVFVFVKKSKVLSLFERFLLFCHSNAEYSYFLTVHQFHLQ